MIIVGPLLLRFIVYAEKEVTIDKQFEDILLVGINGDVLIVGRKRPNESVDIINAFQGEKATELYKKLTEKKV